MKLIDLMDRLDDIDENNRDALDKQVFLAEVVGSGTKKCLLLEDVKLSKVEGDRIVLQIIGSVVDS